MRRNLLVLDWGRILGVEKGIMLRITRAGLILSMVRSIKPHHRFLRVCNCIYWVPMSRLGRVEWSLWWSLLIAVLLVHRLIVVIVSGWIGVIVYFLVKGIALTVFAAVATQIELQFPEILLLRPVQKVWIVLRNFEIATGPTAGRATISVIVIILLIVLRSVLSAFIICLSWKLGCALGWLIGGSLGFGNLRSSVWIVFIFRVMLRVRRMHSFIVRLRVPDVFILGLLVRNWASGHGLCGLGVGFFWSFGFNVHCEWI